MENEPSKSQAERMASLQEAIRDLESFNFINKDAETPNIQQLDIKEGQLIAIPSSGLKKTIDLFASIFTKNPKKFLRLLKVEQKLLDSIAYLKTHWHAIDKLKEGNKEEQKVADWALETIQEYNTLMKKSEAVPPKLVDRVFKTIYHHTGFSVGEGLSKSRIERPNKDISVYFHTSQKKIRSDESDFIMHKIASFLQMHGMLVCMPTTMEIDFFHMKSITLAKNSELPETLSRYLMQWMRKIPIQSMLTKGDQETVEGQSTSIIRLKQTLTPFPGEEITIEGEFRRDPMSSVPSIPIDESFHVTTRAVQTGYPHPSQHDGWAMTKGLLPESPHRIDLLPTVDPLLQKMPHIAQQLLPEGPLNEKAKHLLLLKKEAFADHAEELLELHHRLMLTMIETCPYSLQPLPFEADVLAASNQFFLLLKDHSTPYEALSRAYQQINTLFIEMPYEALKREWIEEANPSLWEGSPKERLQNALNIITIYQEQARKDLVLHLKKSDDAIEKGILLWILLMGDLIGQASRSILLQHLSEKIGFSPPLLHHFERVLQRCAYKHLADFYAELNSIREKTPKIEEVYASFVKHLQVETLFFLQEKEEHMQEDSSLKIIEELEIYYNTQHYRRD